MAYLKHNCGERVQLLTGLPLVVERLAEIVPPIGATNSATQFSTSRHQLDLTQENLITVLTCLMVLFER